jgi:hypothetical protein
MKGCPVFKLKHDQHGLPVHFKAQYVCRGYSAVLGQDSDPSVILYVEPWPRTCQKAVELRLASHWPVHVDLGLAIPPGTL